MANFEKIVEQVDKLPQIRKTLELSAGGKIADDAEILEFAHKIVPDGKAVRIEVSIVVTDLIEIT